MVSLRTFLTHPSLNMPRNDCLRGCDSECVGDLHNFGDLQRFLDLVIASQRRIRLDEKIIFFCPLVKTSQHSELHMNYQHILSITLAADSRNSSQPARQQACI